MPKAINKIQIHCQFKVRNLIYRTYILNSIFMYRGRINSQIEAEMLFEKKIIV